MSILLFYLEEATHSSHAHMAAIAPFVVGVYLGVNEEMKAQVRPTLKIGLEPVIFLLKTFPL